MADAHGVYRTVGGEGEFLSVGERIGRAGIKPVPDVSETKAGAFLCGLLNIDDATVGLIDLDSLLETEAA